NAPFEAEGEARLKVVCKFIRVKSIAERIEHKREKNEEADEDSGHRVKNPLPAEAVRNTSEEECHQECHRNDGPNFNKWNCLGTGGRSGHNKSIFGSAEKVVIETNEESHQQHRNKPGKFTSMDRPQEGS